MFADGVIKSKLKETVYKIKQKYKKTQEVTKRTCLAVSIIKSDKRKRIILIIHEPYHTKGFKINCTKYVLNIQKKIVILIQVLLI